VLDQEREGLINISNLLEPAALNAAEQIAPGELCHAHPGDPPEQLLRVGHEGSRPI